MFNCLKKCQKLGKFKLIINLTTFHENQSRAMRTRSKTLCVVRGLQLDTFNTLRIFFLTSFLIGYMVLVVY